ncbi:MAG: pyridoxamine 5'-phosphate oxidase [Bacteroidota bacterium]
MSKKLADIRKEYSLESLDIDDVKASPIEQFQLWFDEAIKAEVIEPTAMNLATVNEKGRPSSRIVLLKGIEKDAFVFYTNYQSRKGSDLLKNNFGALTFFWPELERQIRIEGVVDRVDESESTAYFQSRPRGSQVGAWASPQSAAIASREILEERVKSIEEKHQGEEVLPRPKQWGGYAVSPYMIEFWQGRESRLHDRIVYIQEESDWKILRLAP